MKVSKLLKAALAKLGQFGENWTKYAYARDSTGGITTMVEEVTCFCSMEALRAAAFGRIDIEDLNDDVRRVAHSRAAILLGRAASCVSFAFYQDRPYRTFAQVKAKFLEAIELAEAQEQAAA